LVNFALGCRTHAALLGEMANVAAKAGV
jgi:hypothetical protein